jgi:D-alanyl-D-alanine carboxypeptidase
MKRSHTPCTLMLVLCLGACPSNDMPSAPADTAAPDAPTIDGLQPTMDTSPGSDVMDVMDVMDVEDGKLMPVDTSTADAADSDPPTEVPRLDDFAKSVQESLGLPGVAVLAFNSTHILARGVAGVRKHDEDAPITDADRWHLGSCTKAMTATIVARLVERGELAFDATLSQLFPDAKVHQDYHDVTVAHLLRHEGGTYSNIGDQAPDLWSFLWQAGEENLVTTRHDFAKAVLAKAPAHTVSTYHYSNTGYIILGSIIENVTGTLWETVIDDEVFAPLGMNHCGFGAPATPGTVDAPWGHKKKANGALSAIDPASPQSDNPPAFGPAGTVHCDLDSWVLYLQGHLGGGPDAYLEPETWELLHTPNPPKKYGFGWLVPQPSTLTHMGSNTMNVVTTWLYKPNNLGFIIVTNTGPVSEIAVPLNAKIPDLAEAVATLD